MSSQVRDMGRQGVLPGIEPGLSLASARGSEVGRERGLVEVEATTSVAREPAAWKEGKKEEGKTSFAICVE